MIWKVIYLDADSLKVRHVYRVEATCLTVAVHAANQLMRFHGKDPSQYAASVEKI